MSSFPRGRLSPFITTDFSRRQIWKAVALSGCRGATERARCRPGVGYMRPKRRTALCTPPLPGGQEAWAAQATQLVPGLAKCWADYRAQQGREVRTKLCSWWHFRKSSIAWGSRDPGLSACTGPDSRGPPAFRGASEDLEAPVVHPDRQLPLLLRVHDGECGAGRLVPASEGPWIGDPREAGCAPFSLRIRSPGGSSRWRT